MDHLEPRDILGQSQTRGTVSKPGAPGEMKALTHCKMGELAKKDPLVGTIATLLDRAQRKILERKSDADILDARAYATDALELAKLLSEKENALHAMREWARMAAADAMEIRLHAEVEYVVEYAAAQKRGQMRKPGGGRQTGAGRIDDLGVDRRELSLWRKLARVEMERPGAIRAAIDAVLGDPDRAMSLAEVLRELGIGRRRTYRPKTEVVDVGVRAQTEADAKAYRRFEDLVKSAKKWKDSGGIRPADFDGIEQLEEREWTSFRDWFTGTSQRFDDAHLESLILTCGKMGPEALRGLDRKTVVAMRHMVKAVEILHEGFHSEDE